MAKEVKFTNARDCLFVSGLDQGGFARVCDPKVVYECLSFSYMLSLVCG